MKATYVLVPVAAFALVSCSRSDSLVGTYRPDPQGAMEAMKSASASQGGPNPASDPAASRAVNQMVIELHSDHTFFNGLDDHKTGEEGTWKQDANEVVLIPSKIIFQGRESTGGFTNFLMKHPLQLKLDHGRLIQSQPGGEMNWSRIGP